VNVARGGIGDVLICCVESKFESWIRDFGYLSMLLLAST